MTFVRKNEYRRLFDVQNPKVLEIGLVIEINKLYYEVVEINHKRYTIRAIEVSHCLEN